MSLQVKFLDKTFANPLVLASGLLGTTGASMARVIRSGAGGVTLKSAWYSRHAGHPNPTVIHLGRGNVINAVGLPHAGIESAQAEIENFRKLSKAPLIANVAGGTLKEFIKVTKAIAELQPDLIEVNISCPNVEDELGRPFACDRRMAERATKATKKAAGKIPVSIKLSPNVNNIAEIARAVEAAGADAITAINTVGPGMVIDIEVRQPILANKVGGLSGPAIRPIAVRCIWEIARAVKIPIIGTGGVATGRDAIELTMAGAMLIGLGSAIAHRGIGVFAKITREMEAWMQKEGVKDLKEIRGIIC